MDNTKSETINVKILAIGLIFITAIFLTYSFLRTNNNSSAGLMTEITSIIKDKLGLSKNTAEGEIDSLAATDTRDTQVAGAEDTRTTAWVATDYHQGDIKNGSYTVKQGDTLWEIAEAVYGDGSQWHKILEANKGSIGYLPNGSQALIVTGQTLNIP